jgi:hypothetical protein
MSFDLKILSLATAKSFPAEICALWSRWINGELSHTEFEVESYRLLKIEAPDFRIRPLRRQLPIEKRFSEAPGVSA